MRELNTREIDLLDRVLRKPELQPFFFRRLKGLHWFNPLCESGFFAPEKNPKPVQAREEGYVSIPSWPAIEYLVTTSEELSATENKEYAVKFVELIRKITSHAKAENYSNYRTWWQLAKVIRNTPVHLIKGEDIELIDYWLDDPYERGLVAEEIGEKWLPDLLERPDDHCHQIALRLLDCLYKINFVEEKNTLYEKKDAIFRFNSYHANNITVKVARLSGLKLGLPAVELLQSRLVAIDSWSSIWRNAIEDHVQNTGSTDNADHLIVVAYRDCLLTFVEHNAMMAMDYIQSLFGSQYPILKRIAIHTIDKHYSALKNLVDTVLAPEYFHDNFRHEMWHLINGHFREISSDQQTRVIEIMEGLEVVDEDKSVNARVTAYKRAIWLSAIKDYSDRTIELYKKYTNITKVEPEHPDFPIYTTSWSGHKSPIPIEHLLTLDIDSLVETINNYKDAGSGFFGGDSLEGLVKAFKEVVKIKAENFYRELEKFSESDLAFIYSLIKAYHELWSEKRELPWNDVWPCLLAFCLELVNRDNFWSEENAKERSHFVANRNWIVGAIGRLIKDGTESDDHAFDEELLPKAQQVLLVLLDRQEGSEFKNDSDAVFLAINSPRGRCIEGLVNLTLRSCRLAHKEHGNHIQAWNQYEGIYDAELKRSQRGEYEFAVLVAMYLPNFSYMSSDWVRAHLADIFDQSDYQKWLCAMQGYIYVNTVYDELYNYLKANNHFLMALDDKNLKKDVHERIMKDIAVAYINGFDDMNQPDSLMSILIERKKLDALSKLIWFIWTLRKKDDVKLKSKVYELWPRLLEIVDVNTKEGRILASNLCHWAAFVDQINATVENWLLKIAPYADENHNAFDLLGSLAEISDTQPKETQNIWIKMLDSYSHDYPEEAIRRIFKNLVALGPSGERMAKDVVDAYIRHGIERPRTWLAEIKATV